MKTPRDTLTVFTAGGLFVSLATLSVYALHLIDRALFTVWGGPPYISIFSTPMGWGMMHMPTAVVMLMIVFAVPLAWLGAVGMVRGFDWLITTLDQPEEEEVTNHV